MVLNKFHKIKNLNSVKKWNQHQKLPISGIFYENLNNSSLFISKKLFMFAGHIAHSDAYCEGAISRFQAALSRHIAIQGSRSRRYCLRSANSRSHSRRVTNFETLARMTVKNQLILDFSWSRGFLCIKGWCKCFENMFREYVSRI